jgi:hypothetical protein
MLKAGKLAVLVVAEQDTTRLPVPFAQPYFSNVLADFYLHAIERLSS